MGVCVCLGGGWGLEREGASVVVCVCAIAFHHVKYCTRTRVHPHSNTQTRTRTHIIEKRCAGRARLFGGRCVVLGSGRRRKQHANAERAHCLRAAMARRVGGVRTGRCGGGWGRGCRARGKRTSTRMNAVESARLVALVALVLVRACSQKDQS